MLIHFAQWMPGDSYYCFSLFFWSGRTREGVTPDAFVMSVGLWHMLHIDDPADYAKQLLLLGHEIKDFVGGLKVWPRALYASVLQIRSAAIHYLHFVVSPLRVHLVIQQVAAAPPMSFFSISEVYPPKLKTEDKRKHLTYQNVDLYNEAIQGSGLLVPDGALYLVDLHHLTQGAALTCYVLLVLHHRKIKR